MTTSGPRLAAALVALGLVASAGPALADLHIRTIGNTRFFIYDAGADHKVTLVGPPSGVSQLRLADVTSASRPLVVAGDLGSNSAAGRGLFLQGGKVISPFNFHAKFDSVVCIKSKKASILSTSDFRKDPVQVTLRCDSAFQTSPGLVRGGRNVVSPLTRGAPQKRILLATKGGRVSVLIFPNPINLFIAAQMLSHPRRLGGAYEFDEVVSLSTNSDPAAYDYKKLLVGNPQRRTTAAIIFDD